MNFDILNRWTGKVQFTANIKCKKSDANSLKIGRAVKWGVENGASLYGANLDGASLVRANLDGANLVRANLDGANLVGANLVRANLDGASLVRANLYGASLYGASLVRANLVRASLDGANLDGANLDGAIGNKRQLKTIQIEQYSISYTSFFISIGCECHSIEEWKEFDDTRILSMDGKSALKFWRKWKDWIFQTIELSPAEPTRKEKDIES